MRAAEHLVAAGTPTVVFLIDDGVNVALRCRPEMARVVAAGASSGRHCWCKWLRTRIKETAPKSSPPAGETFNAPPPISDDRLRSCGAFAATLCAT